MFNVSSCDQSAKQGHAIKEKPDHKVESTSPSLPTKVPQSLFFDVSHIMHYSLPRDIADKLVCSSHISTVTIAV